MAIFEADLQAAVFGVLDGAVDVGDGAVPVYDAVPPSSEDTFPRITFGQSFAVDWSDKGEDGEDTDITIDVWSRKRGRKQAGQIMKAIDVLLHDASLTVAGAEFVMIRRTTSRIIRDEDGKTHHGILVYSAFIHE